MTTSLKGKSSKNENTRAQGRNHHRRITGESSGDDDKPLEIGMTKMNTEEDYFSKSSLAVRRKKSRSPFASSRLAGFTTYENEWEAEGEMKEPFARLKHLEMKYKHRDDEVNSAPESPVALRPRGRSASITSLGSEEDLLDRRMNGITSGLIGLGERVQTPGP